MLRRISLYALIMLFSLAALQAREPRVASQVSIPLPDGKKIKLQQYKGKVVVLAIFSMTCQDCVENVELLNQLQKSLGPQGFQAIAAAGDDNAQYSIGAFTQRYKITFPIGFLNKDEMIAIADIAPDRRPVAPIFLFIDKNGIVRFQYYGDDQFFKKPQNTRLTVLGLLREPSK
jgi:peroxiredoxin